MKIVHSFVLVEFFVLTQVVHMRLSEGIVEVLWLFWKWIFEVCLEGGGRRKTVGRPRFSSEFSECCFMGRSWEANALFSSCLKTFVVVFSVCSLLLVTVSHYKQLLGNTFVLKMTLLGKLLNLAKLFVWINLIDNSFRHSSLQKDHPLCKGIHQQSIKNLFGKTFYVTWNDARRVGCCKN